MTTAPAARVAKALALTQRTNELISRHAPPRHDGPDPADSDTHASDPPVHDDEWERIFAQEPANYDGDPGPREDPRVIHRYVIDSEGRAVDTGPAPPPADGAVPAGARAARIRSLTYRRSQLDSIPAPRYLVDRVLNANVLGLLSGKFGTYKSFVSVSLACSVATGVSWLGHDIIGQGAVVYVAAEGATGLKSRIESWEQAHLNDGQRVSDDRLIVVGGAVNLGLGGDVDAIIGLCAEVGPKLIVWDALHRCAPGVEENSSTEMGRIIHHLDQIREASGAAQLVNHHTGHAGARSRGSSALEDDFDNSWVIKLGGDNEDRSAKTPRTMEHRKVKDGELSAEIPIELVSLGASAYVQRADRQDDGNGWMVAAHLADLANAAGVPAGAGRRALKAGVLAKYPTEKHAESVWEEAARIRKGGSQ
jgi:hypothetical protein